MKRTTEQVLREEIAGSQKVVQATLKAKQSALERLETARSDHDSAEAEFRFAIVARDRAVSVLEVFLGRSSAIENEAGTEKVYLGGDPLPVGVAAALLEQGEPFVLTEEHVHSAEQLAELATLPAPEGVLIVTNAGDAGPEEGTAEVEIVRGGSRVKRGRS